MIDFVWVVVFIAWSVFLWMAGREDGRIESEEKRLIEDFDRVIEQVRKKLGADGK